MMEVTGVFPVTCTPGCPVGYVNVQIGAIVTSGVMELQNKVMYPLVPVVYPASGFTLTVPAAPLPATTLLGATASGDSGEVVSVKSWAAAGAISATRIRKHKIGRLPRPARNVHLESDPSDLNMSRLAFQYLRFLGESKSCPPVPLA